MSAQQVLLIATTAAIATGMVVKQQCRYQNTTSIIVRAERIVFSVPYTNIIQVHKFGVIRTWILFVCFIFRSPLILVKVSENYQENPTLLMLPMNHDGTNGSWPIYSLNFLWQMQIYIFDCLGSPMHWLQTGDILWRPGERIFHWLTMAGRAWLQGHYYQVDIVSFFTNIFVK